MNEKGNKKQASNDVGSICLLGLADAFEQIGKNVREDETHCIRKDFQMMFRLRALLLRDIASALRLAESNKPKR